MKYMSVAGVVFYDGDLNIAVQVRSEEEGTGEVYGFWGGEVEEDETPFQAVKRELKEELGFIPENLSYWDKFTYVSNSGKYKDYQFTQYIFTAPINDKLLKAKVGEGKSLVTLKFKDVINGDGFLPGSTTFLKGFDKYLKSRV